MPGTPADFDGQKTWMDGWNRTYLIGRTKGVPFSSRCSDGSFAQMSVLEYMNVVHSPSLPSGRAEKEDEFFVPTSGPKTTQDVNQSEVRGSYIFRVSNMCARCFPVSFKPTSVSRWQHIYEKWCALVCASFYEPVLESKAASAFRQNQDTVTPFVPNKMVTANAA